MKNPQTGLPAKILLAIVCLVVIGLSAASIHRSLTGYESSSVQPPSAAAIPVAALQADAGLNIDEEVAKLTPKKPDYPRPFDIAQTAAERIRAGDFGAADALLQPYLEKTRQQKWDFYPFIPIRDALLRLMQADFERHAGAWIAKQPNNPLPYYLRARCYRNLAERYRGGGYISKVAESNLKSFEEYIRLALLDIAKARALADTSLYAYLHASTLGFIDGDSDTLKQVFSEAIAKFPEVYPLYYIRMNFMAPKWGGTVADLYKFVDTYSEPAAKGSPLKLLYFNLYGILVNAAKLDCTDDRDKVDKQCVKQQLAGIIRADLPDKLLEAAKLENYPERHAFISQFTEMVCGGCLLIDEAESENNLLLKIAEKLGHHSQIGAADTGGNFYYLDQLQANAWESLNNHGNAEKLLLRAERELAHFDFPDAASHDLRLASLHDTLGEVYFAQGRYRKAIIYAKAADVLLGVVHGGERVTICKAYLELRDYDQAVTSCGEQYELGGSFEALFWRGYAYQHGKKSELALADYRQLAETPNDFQISAATQIPILYDSLGQYQNSLDTYEKYPFLFDPKTKSRRDLAIAYNNRCNVLMHLGRLTEAQADCQTSLKHFEFPEARQKLQQIERQLGGNQT